MYSKMRAKRASQRSCYTHLTRTRARTVTRTRTRTVDRITERFVTATETVTATGTGDQIGSDRERNSGDQDVTRRITIHSPAKSRIILRNSLQLQQTADSDRTRSLEPWTGNVKRQGDWAKETAFRTAVYRDIYVYNPFVPYI